MAPTSTLFRAARPTLRNGFFTSQAQGQAFRTSRMRFGRRWNSTTAEATKESFIKRMWDSPIGLKTVHFWAPVMKWCIVLAGVSDFYRPVEKLSLTQNLALTATGAIWTRWCLIIKPRNVLLASVNFCLGIVGVIQVGRIAAYNYSQKNATTGNQIEKVKESAIESAQGVKKDVVTSAKK